MTSVTDKIIQVNNAGPKFQKVYATLATEDSSLLDSSNPLITSIVGIDYVAGNSGVDASTETLNIIDYEHYKIHRGDHYTLTQVPDIAINNVRDIRITTPNTTKWAHIVIAIDVESETAWFLHEDAVIDTVGTADTPINNNRNSVNTAGMVIDYIDNTNVSNANDDTDITGATEIVCGIIGSGKKSLGASDRRRELILKQNTIYNLRLIATAAGFVNVDLEWYEHTNKN